MDDVESEDLQQRLDRDGPLPEALVLRWARSLCAALSGPHGLVPPVIHRDLKPANLKLTPQGELKLVDCGVAQPAVVDPLMPAAIQACTPGFTPTERYAGQPLDARSDQYALAATLYTLLVGQRPPDSVQRVMGRARLIPPRELRALALRPEDRFPSVAAFAKARPDGTPAEQTRVSPGRRAPASDPGDTLLLPPNPPAPPPAPPAGRSCSRWLLYAVLAVVVVVLSLGAVALGSFLGNYLSGRLSPPASQTPPPSQTLAPAATPTVVLVAAVPSATSAPTQTLAPPTPLPLSPTPTLAPDTPTPAPPAGTPLGSGGRLAFISNRDGQHYQVYTMRPDGSDVQPLTTDPVDKWDPGWTFGGTQLAWSPDGSRLLYVAAGPAGNGTDLFLINADGTGALNLTNGPGDDFHPAWCGDGSIWFTSLRANNTHQIFTTTVERAAAGQRPTNISGTHNYPREYDPVLLPDGNCQRLLFTTTLYGVPEIWRYFLDCPNCYRVVRSERDQGGAAGEPALSADGVYLAYTRRLAGAAEIVVGEVLNRLVNDQVTDSGYNDQPQFSPDGEWLVFTSERDGNREIYRMTRAGAGQTNLSLDPATDTDPVWQPAPP